MMDFSLKKNTKNTIHSPQRLSRKNFELVSKRRVGISLTFIVFLFVTIFTAVYYVRISSQITSSKATLENDAIKTNETTARSVPGQIIVKFKGDVTRKLDEKLKKRVISGFDINLAEEDIADVGVESINSLNRKNEATRITPLFKELKSLQLAKIKDYIELNSEFRSKFPSRSLRNPDIGPPNLLNIYKIEFKSNPSDLNKVLEEYFTDSNVEYAELNYVRYTSRVPNDTYYSEQWAYPKTVSPQGWDINTGSADIVVAVLDTGVDWNHPDLASKIWRNTFETAGDGVDNDGNGYVDDIRGWDFVNLSSMYLSECSQGEDCINEDNDPVDFQGHGTHVSGIAAAASNNNLGVAGMCWGCEIMALRAGWKTNFFGGGALLDEDIVQGLIYAADNGADVVNMSFGSLQFSQVVKDAVNYAYSQGVVLVAAAGNDGNSQLLYPASFNEVLSVSASDDQDKLTNFTNYGSTIDMAAPGVSIKSTVFDNSYATFSGTSMAVPHVSGLVGLLLSKNKSYTLTQLNRIIKQSTDIVLSDKYIGTGRINVYRALSTNNVSSAVSKITSPVWDELIFRNVIPIKGSAGGTSFKVEWGSGIYPTSWNLIGSGSTVTNGDLASWNISQLPVGKYMLRLTVEDSFGKAQDWVLVERYIYSLPILSGWPVKLSTLTKGYSSPVVGDLDGDGNLEVVVGGSHGIPEINEPTVFAFQSNGSFVTGWPKYTGQVSYYGEYQEGVIGSPVLVDLDNDGKQEIVSTALDGKVYVWKNNGQLFSSSWPKSTGAFIQESAIVADLDNNGQKDIIVVASNKNVYAWKQNGDPLIPNSNGVFAKLSNFVSDRVKICVADIDNDKNLEIVIPSKSSSTQGEVYIYKYQGSLYKTIKLNVTGSDAYGCVVGDINKDFYQNIVVAYHNSLYAFDEGGTVLTGWPYTTGSTVKQISLGDINNDGKTDIIAVDLSGKVYIIDYSGKNIPTPISLPIDESRQISEPLIANIDADGSNELILAMVDSDSDLEIMAWNNDGTSVTGWPFKEKRTNVNIDYFNGQIATPYLVDLNKDNLLDLVAVAGNGKVFAINIGVTQGAAISQSEWIKFKHDKVNTNWSGYPILPDRVNPTASITSPAANATVSGTVTIQVNASDSYALKNVEFWVCKATYDCSKQGYYEYLGFKDSPPYNFVWDTTKFSNGGYRIKAVAYDFYQNTGESTVLATVDNVTPTPTPLTNLINNPNFESGTTSWSFNQGDAVGTFTTTTSNPYGGSGRSAQVTVTTAGTSMHLYQTAFSYTSAATYRLTFAGRSNSGHDIDLYVIKHTTPHTNYAEDFRGCSTNTNCAATTTQKATAYLTSSWQTYSFTFTATGFTGTTTDTRFRFWPGPYDAANDRYFIDNVSLTKL